MNTAVAPAQKAYDIVEAVIARGDLTKLTQRERAKYYVRVCQSVGLNPYTRPFEYLMLEGKLVRVLPDHEPEVLGIHAIYLSRQHQPQLLRLMLDHLADRFRAEIAPLDHKLGFDRASRGRARDEG